MCLRWRSQCWHSQHKTTRSDNESATVTDTAATAARAIAPRLKLPVQLPALVRIMIGAHGRGSPLAMPMLPASLNLPPLAGPREDEHAGDAGHVHAAHQLLHHDDERDFYIRLQQGSLVSQHSLLDPSD